jgi:hypothetical protein
MYVAGKLFEKPEDAKAWVEAQTTEEERSYWAIVALAPEDVAQLPPKLRGINPSGLIIKPEGS